jgi:hypothetical protein
MRLRQFCSGVDWRLLVAAAAMVIASASTAADPEPQFQNGVTYMSGGIGESEREAMLHSGGAFNVWVWFLARGTGEYLSDVRVIIADGRDDPVLDTVTDGPWLFARLPPGQYTIRIPDGTHRTVAAAASGHTLSIVEVDQPDERLPVHYLAR